MSYYFGIDIGGTTIKAVLMRNLSHTKPQSFSVATPKNKKEFLVALRRFVSAILSKADFASIGIGIGLPGIIDPKSGILIKAANLPFLDGWKAVDYFQKFSHNVFIENDVKCFILVESKWGAAKGYKNAVGMTFGTGVGAGILINGELYRGKGAAGEIGHAVMQVQGFKGLKVTSFEKLAAKAAFGKYGDRSEMVGLGVANAINILDPDIVVLGGGGVTSGGIKMSVVCRTARKYIVAPASKRTPIVKGKLGEYSQAMGAAFLVKNGV